MFQVAPLPRTLEAARRDLASTKADVRADAARDLGQQGHVPDVEARVDLLMTALGDTAPLVRQRAALALADLEARRSLPALLELFADPDLRVRQMAVLAVGELAQSGDQEVEGRLHGLTRAGDPAIRYQALAALAGLLRADARAEILAAAADSDPEVRELAIRLVGEHLAVEGNLEAELVGLVEAGIRDSEPRVALAAELEALALGLDCEAHQVIALLAGRVRAGEAADERRAIALCGERQIRAALPVLRRRAFGWFGISLDPYRWPLRATLARMGDPRAEQLIARGIQRGRWLGRTLAVEAAAAARLVTLRPHLLALVGHAELVDQDVLDQALATLSDGA